MQKKSLHYGVSGSVSAIRGGEGNCMHRTRIAERGLRNADCGTRHVRRPTNMSVTMTTNRWLAVLVAASLSLAACSQATTSTTSGADGSEPSPSPDPSVVVPDVSTTDIRTFMDEVTRALLERDPEWMTDLGLADRHDRLTPVDRAYRDATAAVAQAALDELAASQPDINGDDAVSLAVFEWWLEDIVDEAQFRQHDNPVNYITGAHVNLPEFLIDVHPIRSVQDARDYVARMEAIGPKMEELGRQVEQNADDGYRMTGRSRDIARWQVQQLLEGGGDALVTELGRRMTEAGLASQDVDRITDAAAAALDDVVLPAYRDLEDVLSSVDVRSADGVWDLPNGAEYYRWVLRHYTTSEMSPEDMHEWGLAEVERVRSEIRATLESMGYDTTNLNQAIGQAIDDAGRVPLGTGADRQAFLDANTEIIEHAYVAFADMFSLVPAAEVVIQRPAPSREGGAGAYYRNPDLAGTRPGIYYLSMGQDSRTAHDFKTTTYHEAIPGHHFQLALQAELDNPLHQQAVVFSGYAEGWALYAERLAFEAGLYDDDPFGNIGRLQLELLRAVRVVTDTGIHAMRWTRAEAIRYHQEFTALPEQWSTSEVDRYIVWPGQAPGYLLGMDVILEARADAQSRLGASFDIAGFHDAVLGYGALPLAAIEQAVDNWVADTGG